MFCSSIVCLHPAVHIDFGEFNLGGRVHWDVLAFHQGGWDRGRRFALILESSEVQVLTSQVRVIAGKRLIKNIVKGQKRIHHLE